MCKGQDITELNQVLIQHRRESDRIADDRVNIADDRVKRMAITGWMCEGQDVTELDQELTFLGRRGPGARGRTRRRGGQRPGSRHFQRATRPGRALGSSAEGEY